jgi:hypothetical protein
VAETTDAARDRVLAARTDLEAELRRLEASARAAVDIPAKVRRNPARAAAIAGGAGFVALGGPGRVLRRVKRAIRGPEAEIPASLLPEEIERTLRKLGSDGDRIRGTLERDFAAYTEAAAKGRGPDLGALLTGLVARPVLTRAGKAAAEWLFTPEPDGFAARLDQVRERVVRERGERDERGDTGSSEGGSGS